MILHIKNMVCRCCILAVGKILEEAGVKVKQITGMSPKAFKQQRDNSRIDLSKIGGN